MGFMAWRSAATVTIAAWFATASITGAESSTITPSEPETSNQPLNVLMIAVDDLRPSGTTFGHSEIKVPNIDKLAARGTSFTQAFCQAATCGVSRSSLLTGRRPDSTYVLSNGECPFTTAAAHEDWQSIPEYFRANGYTTVGMGKVFHPNICAGAAVGERSQAWSLPYYHAPCISLGSIYDGKCYENYPGPLPEGPGGKVTSIFSNTSIDATDETMPDGMIAAHAVRVLKEMESNKPFFMAVGFHKPHLPHIAPAKYFDLYPLDDIELPSNASRHAPQGAPDIAWNSCSEMLSYKDSHKDFAAENFSRNQPVGDDLARRQRQAYYAAASYSDAQIGKVLDALDELNLTRSTIVALWGDHGWHLGENNEWAKHTAMTWANRAPLIFVAPQQANPGSTNENYAEFVDIYPTLVDLSGIGQLPVCANTIMSQQSHNCTEGKSLKSVIMGGPSDVNVVNAAFSQWPKGGRMGYNVFTEALDGSRVRYTEWVNYKNHSPVWHESVGVELYNHSADPNENFNIAAEPALASEVQRLSTILHNGWRGGQ